MQKTLDNNNKLKEQKGAKSMERRHKAGSERETKALYSVTLKKRDEVKRSNTKNEMKQSGLSWKPSNSQRICS